MSAFRIQFLLVTATRREWLCADYEHPTTLALDSPECRAAAERYLSKLMTPAIAAGGGPRGTGVQCPVCHCPLHNVQAAMGCEISASVLTHRPPRNHLIAMVQLRALAPCSTPACRATSRELLHAQREEVKTRLRECTALTLRRVCGNCYRYEELPLASPGEHYKQCSTCRDTHYCSAECQLKDWKEHRKVCRIPPV